MCESCESWHCTVCGESVCRTCAEGEAVEGVQERLIPMDGRWGLVREEGYSNWVCGKCVEAEGVTWGFRPSSLTRSALVKVHLGGRYREDNEQEIAAGEALRMLADGTAEVSLSFFRAVVSGGRAVRLIREVAETLITDYPPLETFAAIPPEPPPTIEGEQQTPVGPDTEGPEEAPPTIGTGGWTNTERATLTGTEYDPIHEAEGTTETLETPMFDVFRDPEL